jgi:hypothetical protein
MKIGEVTVPASTRAAALSSVKSLGAQWLRFGNDVVVYCSDDKWNVIKDAAYRDGFDLKERGRAARTDDFYLVTQLGRIFQLENKDVPVLFDKGRYLIVSLNRKHARRLSQEHKTCYSVKPLEEYSVVFDVKDSTSGRRLPVAWIQDLVNLISRSDFESNLTTLAGYPTRYSTSTHFISAIELARVALDSQGYTTRTENFAVGSGMSRNLIAERPGRSCGPRKLVLVTAHLDSININGGPSANAPGADDNGSGAAGLLELARLLKDHPSTHDLRFILFGGEEQGLIGSNDYVSRLDSNERARITAAINMDMIATLNSATPTVLLEGGNVSQPVMDGLVEAAMTYTGLTVQTSLNPFASDHVPFINAGVPAVLTIEGVDGANSNIHTASDTLAHINYDLALEILRMNIAYVASALGKHGGLIMTDSEKPKVLEDLTLIKPEELIELMRVQYSGRYPYNGGVSTREPGNGIEDRSDVKPGVLNNPIYNLDKPVFIENPKLTDLLLALRFTLHIDIDGTDPLNVVSGAVRKGSFPIGNSRHFIGRVTSNTASGAGRDLIVEDLDLQWPGSSSMIGKLEIHLTGGFFNQVTAEVKFITTSGKTYGPYTVKQKSRYFHDVEVDVDRENGTADILSYNTHTHPDRPADLPEETLTLERAFRKAGIKITRSSGSGTVIDTTGAGVNNRWNYQELHDSMTLHWDAYANKPQWKMWIFQAGLADSDSLGGVMFDGEIDEPGGVDRQGTAVFTLCPFFHTAAGAYPQANPPAAQAAERELFFDLIHETGHAFNLAHSWQKQEPSGQAWPAPAWKPLLDEPQALSWMNYPDEASPGSGLNGSWFYNRFRFRFDDDELLFMRHAPSSFLQMGNSPWFQNHARVARESLDSRLRLELETKRTVEMGEPVFLQLSLTNVSAQPILLHGNMDPSDGFVEIAVTNPRGERRPFIPIDHTRNQIVRQVLEPGQTIRQPVKIIIGRFGFPFKDPGFYRLEASYTNLDGTTAAAIMQLYVNPAGSVDDMRALSELFNARVGRVLYFGGSRVLEDVNDTIDWVRNRLGERHPTNYFLTATRYMPEATPSKIVDPQSKKIRVFEADPERVARQLESILSNEDAAIKAIGRAAYREMSDLYGSVVLKAQERSKARHAQDGDNHLAFLRRSGGISSVVEPASR